MGLAVCQQLLKLVWPTFWKMFRLQPIISQFILPILASFFGNFRIFGSFWDLLGHPEIGTAITKCFEHLDDEKHILDPGQLDP